MFFKQLIPALALLCLITGSYAENIKTVEVVADRIERQSIAEIDLAQYNGFESIVTREAFAGRLVNIADVINEMPSVQTFSTGGMGSYTSASIRGSTGKQVNIFVDGILLSSPASGYSNLGLIPTSIIEAIEVYPDYTPVQLSDGNLAGAINIRTRQLQEGDAGGTVSAAYGSFDTWKTEASAWGGNASTEVLLAGSATASDNDFPVSPDLFPAVSAGASDKRQNAAFAQQDIFAKVKHALTDKLDLQAMANYSDSNNELPTIQNKDDKAATLDTTSLRANIGLESVKNNNNWGWRLYTNNNESLFKDLQQSIALQAQQIKTEEQSLGSTVYLESIISRHIFNTSLDIESTDIDKNNFTGTNENIEASREKLTLALADTWVPIDDLSLYGLLRGHHVADKTQAGSANFSASCNINDKDCLDSEHNETSWQLGGSYDLNNKWRIKSNIGHSLRIPTLAEKYGEMGNYIGEPDLKPESANSIDTGFIFNKDQISAALTAFARQIDNGIYISYDARGVGHPSNISESQIIGLEFDGNWLVTDELSLSLGGYSMDSENQSGIKANKGKKLHGFYHNGYVIALTWSNQTHIFNTTYQADDELFYTPANSVKADTKDSLNMSYTWVITSWKWNIGINNLLDNQYSDFNRMPSTGRSLNTSIHYEF